MASHALPSEGEVSTMFPVCFVNYVPGLYRESWAAVLVGELSNQQRLEVLGKIFHIEMTICQ